MPWGNEPTNGIDLGEVAQPISVFFCATSSTSRYRGTRQPHVILAGARMTWGFLCLTSSRSHPHLR